MAQLTHNIRCLVCLALRLAEATGSSPVVPATFLRFAGPALRLLLFPATETRWYQAMPVGWKNHVASEPEFLRGKARLKGTRIPLGLSSGTSPLSKPLRHYCGVFRSHARPNRRM